MFIRDTVECAVPELGVRLPAGVFLPTDPSKNHLKNGRAKKYFRAVKGPDSQGGCSSSLIGLFRTLPCPVSHVYVRIVGTLHCCLLLPTSVPPLLSTWLHP